LEYSDDDTGFFNLLDTSGTTIFSVFPLREKDIDPNQRCHINSPAFGAGQILSSSRLSLGVRYRVEMQVNSSTSKINAQLYNDETEDIIGTVSNVSISSEFIRNSITFETQGPGPLEDTDGSILFDNVELFTLNTEDANGVVEVRINGVTVISESNKKTVNTSELSYSSISLNFGSEFDPGVATDIDDFCIWDDTGAWNNSFLGDKRALLKAPDADTNVSDFDPVSGDLGYLMVDEDSPDDDVTYLFADSGLLPSSPPIGSSEFEIRDLPNGTSHIAGVSVFTRAKKTDSSDVEIFTSVISNINSVSGSQHALDESYSYHIDLYEYDPFTIANFTPDSFNLALVSINSEFEIVPGSPVESPGSPVESPGGDPFFDDVVSLLHFDGTDASTTFTDVIGNTWTANGNAQIDTAQSKFGGSSGLFDGTGDYLQSTETGTMNAGANDFTIEAWIRPSVVSGTHVIFSKQQQNNDVLQFRVNANKLEVLIRQGLSTNPLYQAVSSSSVSTGTFQHVAAVRNGNDLKVFIDGALEATTTDAAIGSVDLTNTAPGIIGAVRDFPSAAVAFFNGHIDDLRVTVVTARYTSSFTPPTAPFEDF
jgi:hypothetical protein